MLGTGAPKVENLVNYRSISMFLCPAGRQYDVKVKFVLKVYTVGSLSHDKFESYLQGVSTGAPKTKSGQKRVFFALFTPHCEVIGREEHITQDAKLPLDGDGVRSPQI